MQRSLPPLPAWMTFGAIVLAVGIVTLLAFTLRRDSGVDDANDRVQTSALLPDNVVDVRCGRVECGLPECVEYYSYEWQYCGGV